MISLLLTFLLTIGSSHDIIDPCDVYGKIYVVNNPGMADFRVYIEESESFADVLVFKQSNSLFADRPGQWAFVENKSFANAYIYFEKKRNLSDFTIAYIDVESFAGCNR